MNKEEVDFINKMSRTLANIKSEYPGVEEDIINKDEPTNQEEAEDVREFVIADLAELTEFYRGHSGSSEEFKTASAKIEGEYVTKLDDLNDLMGLNKAEHQVAGVMLQQTLLIDKSPELKEEVKNVNEGVSEPKEGGVLDNLQKKLQEILPKKPEDSSEKDKDASKASTTDFKAYLAEKRDAGMSTTDILKEIATKIYGEKLGGLLAKGPLMAIAAKYVDKICPAKVNKTEDITTEHVGDAAEGMEKEKEINEQAQEEAVTIVVEEKSKLQEGDTTKQEEQEKKQTDDNEKEVKAGAGGDNVVDAVNGVKTPKSPAVKTAAESKKEEEAKKGKIEKEEDKVENKEEKEEKEDKEKDMGKDTGGGMKIEM